MSRAEIGFVGAVYDAVLDPRGLHVFTDLLMANVDASSAFLELNEGPNLAVAASNIPERVTRLYAEHYHAVNPLLVPAKALGAHGRATRASDLVPDGTFFETEFFCDFARPVDRVRMLGGAASVGARKGAIVAAHRGMGEPDFSEAERRRAQRVLASAARALQLRERLGKTQGAGFAAFEVLAFGAMVCDGTRQSPDVIAFHPVIVERYRALVRDLRTSLAAREPERKAEVIEAVRGLIDRVVVYPRDDPNDRDLELAGQLGGLLGTTEDLRSGMGRMVAEEGLEPPTPGL